MICVPLLGRDPARRDRPIRTGRRDKPIIQLPSVALRVAVIVGIAAVLFGIIFFRLWFLQILSGQEFVAQANDNRLRSVKVVAPRGYIVDRNGEVIVENRAGVAVGIRLMDVPKGTLDEELATPRARPPHEARGAAQAHQGLPVSEHAGAERRRHVEQLPHLEEGDRRGDHRPRPHRAQGGRQPQGDVLPQGAHAAVPRRRDPGRLPALRTRRATWRRSCSATSARSRPSSSRRSTSRATRPATSSATTASSGPTTSGCAAATASPRSRSTPSAGPSRPTRSGGRLPDPGDTLVTTIDAKVQAAAEEALRTGISLAHADGQYDGQRRRRRRARRQERRRARHGQLPDLRPRRVGRRHKPKTYKQLTRKSANYPLLNRATQETKAVGSTFKADHLGGRARGGRHHAGDHLLLPRLLHLAERPRQDRKFKCWALDGHGNLDLVGAITQSCDVYFYNVGYLFYHRPRARPRGLGRAPRDGQADGHRHPLRGRRARPDAGVEEDLAYFKTEIDKLWKPSDSIYLAVGQGNLEATPLQLATSTRRSPTAARS